MRVRTATPADAEAIRDVHYHSITKLGTDGYSREQVDAWAVGCESADYTATITADEMEATVAEIDDVLVGFGTLKLAVPEGYEADVDAEITGVYVHPSVVRQGVGTRLYAELERRARTQRVQALGLCASRNAVPFYEAHGYERVAEHAHEFSGHESTGVTGTVVEMKKTL